MVQVYVGMYVCGVGVRWGERERTNDTHPMVLVIGVVSSADRESAAVCHGATVTGCLDVGMLGWLHINSGSSTVKNSHSNNDGDNNSNGDKPQTTKIDKN